MKTRGRAIRSKGAGWWLAVALACGAGLGALALSARAAADTTAPTVSGAALNGKTLTITFNETMGPAKPGNDVFTVAVAGAPSPTVSSYSVAGTTATLTLSRAVRERQTVTVAYAKPARDPVLEDAAGNDLAAFSGQAVRNDTLDVTPPMFRSASVDGKTLTLRFNETMGSAKADNTAFTVSVLGATDPTVSSYSLAGKTATLTLSAAVRERRVVTVAYAKPQSGTVLADAAGNDLATFLAQPVTNETADVTVPTVRSASVAGKKLTIRFDEAMGAAKAATNAFTVAVAGATNPTVSSYSLVGTRATLTLSGAVAHGQVVTLDYAKPETPPVLEDAAGNDLASFTGQAVSNETPDVTAPTVSGAVVDGKTLTVTFSEAMGAAKAGNDAFTVAVAGAPSPTVSAYTVVGTTATLTLSRAVRERQSVTLSYAKPARDPVLEDETGNDLASFSARTVRNDTADVTEPMFRSATVDGATLTLTFSETMGTAKAANTAFTVAVAGATNPTVSDYTLAGATATLTLSAAVRERRVVTVAYTEPQSGTVLEDAAGNDLATFLAQPVTNETADVTVPTVRAASVSGNKLTIGFAEAMGAAKPAASAFSVAVTGRTDPTVISYTLSGTKAVLTLSAAIGHGETVSLDYAKPATPPVLEDRAGNDLESFTGQTVANETPDITVPTVSGAVIDGKTLTITFSEAMGTTKAGNDAFTVAVAGAPDPTVSSYTVAGTTAALSLSRSVRERQSVTVSYAKPTSGPVLEDEAGNDLASFSARNVRNDTADVTKPMFRSATVNAATLAITFSEAMGTPVPTTSAFTVSASDTANTSVNNVSVSGRVATLTISPAAAHDTEVTVAYTKPDSGAVLQDTAATPNPLATFTAQPVTNNTPDVTAPMLQGVRPADNTTGVAVDTDLAIDFDENVQLGASGNIVITETGAGAGHDVRTIPVTDAAQVSATGKRVRIDPNASLQDGKEYSVTIEAGAVEDTSSNPFAGILDATAWSFTTADATPPVLAARSPADDEVGVAVDADLTLTFDEDVMATTGSGAIVLTAATGAADVRSIAATDTTQVSVSGKTVTIDPSADLRDNTGYFVTVAPKAFEDRQGNHFAGLTGTDAWSFSTAPRTGCSGRLETSGTVVDAKVYSDATTAECDPSAALPRYATIRDDRSKSKFLSFKVPSAKRWTITLTGTKLYSRNEVHLVLRQGQDNGGGTYVARHDGGLKQSDPEYFPPAVITRELEAGTWYTVEATRFGWDSPIDHHGVGSFSVVFTSDGTAPVVETVTPMDGAASVSTDTVLKLTFDETVRKGASGGVTIAGSRVENKGKPDERTISDSRTIAVSDARVTFEDGTVQGRTVAVDPGTPALKEGFPYTVTMDAGAFEDASGNAFAGIQSTARWNFTTATCSRDLGTMPAGRTTSVSETTELGCEASVAVPGGALDRNKSKFFTLEVGGAGSWRIELRATGTDADRRHDAHLVLRQGADDRTGTVLASDDNGGAGQDARIVHTLSANTKYTIEASRRGFGSGLLEGTGAIRLSIGKDATGPVLSSLDPADESTGAGLGKDLTLTFNEDVKAGTGNIEITASGGVSDTRTISVTDSTQVRTVADRVIIDPSTNLRQDTAYHVKVPSGAVTDLSGNGYPGFTTTTAWNFTTAVCLASLGTVTQASGKTHDDDIVDACDASAEVPDINLEPIDNDKSKFFKFQVDTAGSWSIGLHASVVADETPNAHLMLREGEGTTSGAYVAIDDDGGPGRDARIFHSLATGTWYTIEATRYGLGGTLGTGGIRLTLTRDATAPASPTLSPADGATDVALGADLTLTFNEEVKTGTGNIMVRTTGSGDVRTITANGSGVTASGRTVTIDPGDNLHEATDYHVTIPAGALKDLSGNAYGGITTSTGWNFTTADCSTGLDSITTSETRNDTIGEACDASADVPKKIRDTGPEKNKSRTYTFTPASAGNWTIELHAKSRGGGGTEDEPDAYLILREGTKIVARDDDGGGGSDARIIAALKAGTEYAVEAVRYGEGGNLGSGGIRLVISKDTDQPTVSTYDPADGASSARLGGALTLTFDEEVRKGSGNITIKGGGETRTVPVGSGWVTVNGRNVAIRPAANNKLRNLLQSTAYHVKVDSGAFEDAVGNAYAGINDETTWNFTTGGGCTDDLGRLTAPTSKGYTTTAVCDASPELPASDVTRSLRSKSKFVTFTPAYSVPWTMRLDAGRWDPQTPNDAHLILRRGTGNLTGTPLASHDNVSDNDRDAVIVHELTKGVAYTLEATRWGHSGARGVGSLTLQIHPEAVPPTVRRYSPAHGAVDVGSNASFVLVFSEDVTAGSGNVVFTELPEEDGSDNRTFDVAGSEVTVSGKTVRIDPASDLEVNTTYEVTMAAGVVKDVVGNAHAGIGSGAWTFVTGGNDGSGPEVRRRSPVDDAVGIAVDANLALTFDEEVRKGSGDIVITPAVGSPTTITVTDEQVRLNGPTVTIDPSVDLETDTSYHVTVASGAFMDTAGNAFGGISGNTEWSFATVDTIDPEFASATARDETLTITFNEAMGGVKASNEAFTVAVNGRANPTVSSYAVADATAVLTLSSAVLKGETVTVAYTKPESGPVLGDTAGNPLATFAAQTVANQSPDRAPPTVSGAAVDGKTLTVTFSEAMGAAKAGNDAFTVAVAGAPSPTVSGYTVAGTTATLTLSRAVRERQSVTLAYAKPARDPVLEDAAGNDLATFSARSVRNDTPDVTEPMFRSATVNGVTLTITFDETLGTAKAPDAAFTVAVAGATDPTVTSYSLLGATATLTLSAAVRERQVVTVAYAKPDSGTVLQDTAATPNALATFPAQPVTNETLDVTVPTVRSASVNAKTLTITFDEAMGAAKAPDAAFTVAVAGATNPTVSSYTLLGATGTLTLSGAVAHGQVLTLDYTKPGSGAVLEDAAGNDLESFTGQAVSNETPDVTAPTVSGAVVDGKTLTVTFSEAMGAAKAGNDAFTVAVAGAPSPTVSSYTVAGTTATLTLSRAVRERQSVTLAYTKPARDPVLEDEAGNDLASFSARTVRNDTPDVTEPMFRSATVNGATLAITFSEALGAAKAANAAFTVTVDGATDPTVTSYELADAVATLTLSSAVRERRVVTVAYTKPDSGSVIGDGAATPNALASFAAQPVTNETRDVTAPTVANAAVNGKTLTVTFNEAMGAAKAADAAFTVAVAGVTNPTVSSYTLVGTKATLTLSSAVAHGGVVTLDYAKPDSGAVIEDAAGNDLASFTGRAVMNETPDVTAPTVSGASVDGKTLTVTFSEAMGAAKAGNDAFTVALAGAPSPTVSGYTVAETTATLTLSRAVRERQSVTLAYAKPAKDPVLEDAAGNDLASFSARTVRNDTADTTKPAFRSARVDGATLAITFNEAMGTAKAANDRFAVAITGATDPTVTSYELGGATATLTLSSAVRHDHTVTVAYSKPDSGTVLADAAGNALATFPAQPTTNATRDMENPSVSTYDPRDGGTADIDDDLVLTFDETVKAGTGNIVIDATGAKGTDVTILVSDTQIRFNGRTVTIDPSADLAAGAAYAVKIAATAIKDASNNLYGGINNTTTWNFTTTTPSLSAGSVTDRTASLALANYGSAWWHKGNQTGATCTAVSAGTSSASLSGLDASTSYTYKAYAAAGCASASELATAIFTTTADTTKPTFVSATVYRTTLTITFSEALATAADLASSAFTVKKTPSGGSEETVGLTGSPSITGTKVVLTLDEAVAGTDSGVKVAYTKPTGTGTADKLEDGAGNEVDTFSAKTVTMLSKLALALGPIAGDNVVNIAEKTAGFTVSGPTGTVAGASVSVRIGSTSLAATSATGGAWSVTVPANASYLAETSVNVRVNATRIGFANASEVLRAVTVDLVAPSAPTWTAPASLKVGVAIAAISPSGGADVVSYSATGLPAGLSIHTTTGVVSGTPTAHTTSATSVVVTVSDANANTADSSAVSFPAVAKGTQDLTGFAYSSTTATIGGTAPMVTAPSVKESAGLTWSTTADAGTCSVDSATGALTIGTTAGSCPVKVAAAATTNYAAGERTVTVAVVTAIPLTLDTVAGDDRVNSAEKAAGFAISGKTGTVSGATVSVVVGSGTALAATSGSNGAWSVSVAANSTNVAEGTVALKVTAGKAGLGDTTVTKNLAVDLTAPTAPSYTAPASLKVGVAITAISPSGGSGINAYSAAGLPAGLSINTSSGAVSGVPTAHTSSAASVVVTVSDTAGNTAAATAVSFPAVAKGTQDLSAYKYSAATADVGGTVPTLTPPVVRENAALSYSTTATSSICSVDSSTGALTIGTSAGSCPVKVSAAATTNYAAKDATFTIAVRKKLTLTLSKVAGDDVVNIAEKTAGFTVSGTTGTVAGASVSVRIGSTTLAATSATGGAWSVTVPADASYLAGTSVNVRVTATRTGFADAPEVLRAVTVDLVAPSAPTWTAPTSLKVGVAITAISPSGGSGIAAYRATGLPAGLSMHATTGVVSGVPSAYTTSTASMVATVRDAAGNTATGSAVSFPAVARGTQDLSAFGYTPATVTVGGTAPVLSAPVVRESATLGYSTTAAAGICTVHSTSGAFTIGASGGGGCPVKVAAAQTTNYAAAERTVTVTVQAVLPLTVAANVAGDNRVNIAEKAAGFAVSGTTGAVSGATVSVRIGAGTLAATSSSTGAWSVTVPANASYVAGPSVTVVVGATRSEYGDAVSVRRTLAVDLARPGVSSAEVDGTGLDVVFGETLGAAANLANTAFTVKKTPAGGSEQVVGLSGSPSVSGTKVRLTLNAAVVASDTGVKVSYVKPGAGAGKRIVDVAGNEASSFSNRAVDVHSVPATPGGVSARHSGDRKVTLRWKAAARANAYQYQRREQATGKCSTTGSEYGAWTAAGTGTSHDVGSLTNGTRYCFRVRGTNADGQGAASGAVDARPVAAPAVPGGLGASGRHERVKLSWTAAARAADYEYRYKERSGASCAGTGYGTWESAGTGTGHEVVGLTTGTTYCFEVRAANPSGESAPSTAASATPPTPIGGNLSEPNTHSQTVAGDVQVAGRFLTGGGYGDRYTLKSVVLDVADSGTGQLEVSFHDPKRGSANGAPGPRLAILDGAISDNAGPTTFTTSGITLSGYTWYYVKVRAKAGASRTVHTTLSNRQTGGPNYWSIGNKGFWSGDAGASWSTMPATLKMALNLEMPGGAGGAGPKIFLLAPQDRELLVMVVPVAGATRYQHQHKAHPGGSGACGAAGYGDWTTATHGYSGGNDIDYIRIPDLDNGTRYCVRVRALTGSLAGAASPARARAPAAQAAGPVPGKPTDVSATRESGQVWLSWKAAATGDPAGAWEYRRKQGTGTWGEWDMAPVAAGAKTRFAPPGLTAGAAWAFQVRGFNIYGWGPASAEAPAAAFPSLSVADASTREPGEGVSASLDFKVTLDRAAAGTVTVDYATRDGTATAGSDYTAASGTLTFAAGETEKTVAVPVLADAHDDGGETLALVLSNASGAVIADGEATGTITNDGPIPKAWIARFGRTVAGQVLDAVEGRMRAAPQAGTEVSLGGMRIGGDAAAGNDEAAREAERPTDWIDNAGDSKGGEPSGSVTQLEFVLGSSLALTSQTASGDLVSFWGRGVVTAFDGREGGLNLDGEVTSALLGADWTWDRGPASDGPGRFSAGLLLSHSVGEGGYAGAPDAGGGSAAGMSGKVEASLTGLFPWVRHAPTERVEVWGVGGYGEGALEVTPGRPGDHGAALRADLDLWMAAGGLRGALLGPGAQSGTGGGLLDGLALTGKTDAMFVGTSSGRGTGAGGGHLAPARATVSRLRLGLEASRPLSFRGGAVLTPGLETGVRHDGGDAETGFGLDLGGGIALSDPKRGLQAELRGRGLLSHAAGGFRERGFSGSFSWRQKPDSDRGATVSLTQTVGGASSGGADALLSRVTMDGLSANDAGGGDDDLASRHLDLKLGYGLSAFGGRFTLTPELGAAFSNGGRDYRLGWHLTRARGAGPFDLSLEAARRESANDNGPPEHEIEFRVDTQF